MASAAPRALPTRRRGGPAGQGSGSVAESFGAQLADDRFRDLPLEAIHPNPDQPRKQFDEPKLELLAASLRERGLLQPVLVRPIEDHYELIAGERRWRAAHLAGLEQLPAFIRTDTDDGTSLELALTENAARQDLTVVEEARTLSALLDDLKITQQVLAQRVGRSRSDLANTVRLLELPDQVLDLLNDRRLTKGHGKALLAEPDHHRRASVAREAVHRGWSVRELEQVISSGHARDKARRATVPADQREAARRLAETLAAHVRAPVKVKPRGSGFAIELVADGLAHAEEIVAAFTPR